MLIRDIFPKEKIKKIAKERVLGIKPYKTKRAKYFNIGYRIFIGAILVSLTIFSFTGFSFGALDEKEFKVEVYSSSCTSDFEGQISVEGWQRPEKAQDKPDVLASGSIESFFEGNSAIYKGGLGDLICEGFDNPLINPPINTDNTPLNNTNNKLKNTKVSDGSSNAGGDLVGYNFQSAKIHLSFAIDNTPLTKTNNIPLNNTNYKLKDTKVSGGSSDISDSSWNSSPNIDTKIVIWYSIDNETWYSLDKISYYPLSNALNGGYFSYDAPFLENWEDAKNLKIKFEGAVGGETDVVAFIDSVWVEVEYTKIHEKENETNANDAEVKLVSSKKDFKSGEEPEIKFHYQKTGKGVINSALESLGLSDGWKDINVKTKIIDVDGKDTEIVPDVIFGKNGEFSVKVKKGKELKPGLYKIVLEVDDRGLKREVTQDFTWGVLAINVNKSIYLPGEEAYLQMGVLKDDGHTVCDASLNLQITNQKSETTILTTEDGAIQYSEECGPDNVTDKPDYFAYYQVGEAGIYQMKLTNLDNGYEITDSFEVRESVPFDVERIGPTRIYPPATYEMKIKIKVNQDFTGQVVEQVPASLEVINPLIDTNNKLNNTNNFGVNSPDISGDSLVATEGEIKKITWQVAWEKGEEYELRYQFNAPDISPYFYLLGPLGIGNFQEIRQWQIAADAVAPDGLLIYSDSTTASTKYRALTNPTTLGNETSDGLGLSTDAHNEVLRYSPTKNEFIAGQQHADGKIVVRTFDGSSWTTQQNISGLVATTRVDRRAFDIAYERLSGKAMWVYADDPTTGKVYYCTYDGNSWGPVSDCAPTNGTNDINLTDGVNPLTGVPTKIKLIQGMPGSNNLWLLVEDTNADLYVIRWNGTSWDTDTDITASTALSCDDADTSIPYRPLAK